MTKSDERIDGIYKPRKPKETAFYNCVENHFEELESVWDDLYAPRYGFWRPYITDVIYRWLDCGDLRCGFARIRCDNCGHEYLLPFSCKRRHFCPSCHQKLVVEYGEWLLTDVLKKVPRRHWVFSIPKRLRIYFMYDRSLLGKLSKCAWNVTSAFLKSAVPRDGAVPGASIAIQTYGDFLNFNPHLHAIVTDGCFLPDGGGFVTAPGFYGKDLEEAFQHEVFTMLKKEGKINDDIIENMLSWRHTGFHVYIGNRIRPNDATTPLSKTCFHGDTPASTSISAQEFGPKTRTLSAILPNTSFEPVFPRSACSTSPPKNPPTALPRSSAPQKTERPSKPSTPSTGSRGSSFIYRINTSSWFGTSGITQTSREA